MRMETARFPNLKLLPLSDETHFRSYSCEFLDAFRENDTTVRIDFQDLARPEQSHREGTALLRIGRVQRQKLIDLPQQRIAAALDCGRIQRGMNEKPLEPVPRQHRPEARRDRHPALRIQPICELRDETIHNS